MHNDFSDEFNQCKQLASEYSEKCVAIDHMVDKVLSEYVLGHSNLMGWQKHFNNCLVELQTSLKEVEEEKHNANSRLVQLRSQLNKSEKTIVNEYGVATKNLIEKINEKSSRMEVLSAAVSKLKLQNILSKINLKIYTDLFPADVRLHDNIYDKYPPNAKALELAAKIKPKNK